MDLRRNNFDLLRLLFAASVLFWHAGELSREPALQGVLGFFSADLGVKGFFVVSGYLVVASFENSASLADYAGKRVRRIYPAYFSVVLLCAIAGLALTTVPAAEYFTAGLARYLAANLAFLNFLAPTLPGVFSGNAWNEVNGALWTLKVEVMFYAAVPLIVLACRRIGAARVLAGLYGLSLAYSFSLAELAQESGRPLWVQLQRQLPGQLTYFLAGAALYVYRDRAARHWPALVGAAAFLFVLQKLAGGYHLLATIEPLWLAVAVVYAALGMRYLGNFARFGDFSYGIYILHFPVIQAAVAAGYFARAPWLAFAACTVTTFLLALLCWHFIEKPFLRRSSHYRLAEKPA